MSPTELLRHVVEILDRAGIRYVLTGSVVSSLQGEPRSTHDIDIVVAIDRADIPSLLAAFPPPGFYVDEAAIREAIDTGGVFNVLNVVEGDKVDFWLLTDEPFDQSRIARRIQETVFGFSIWVTSPEDTILAKLRWSRLAGESRRTYTDALRVYEVQGDVLDQEYLTNWARELGVSDLLEAVRGDAV